MPPTPKSLALGNMLKQARENRELTIRQLADMIGCSHSQISKWENAEAIPRPEQVAQVLTKLDINGEVFDSAVNLARSAKSSSWVATTLPTQRQQLEAIADFQLSATKIVTIQPLLVPGLLQTSDYGQKIMESAKVPSGELATRLAIRLGSKNVITREHRPVRYVAFVGYTAIHSVIGGKSVMAEQYKHLLNMAQRPNIELCVIRHDNGWNPSHEGPFDIVESGYSAVVLLENRRSSLILHKRDDVRAYQDAADMVQQTAMSPQDSLRYIASVAKRMENSNASSHVDKVKP